MAWAADPSRKAEASDLFTIPIIQMGARVYLPTAGRFLQVDPVDGGTANSYVYALDPINSSDYSGQSSLWESICSAVKNVVKVITVVANMAKKIAPTAISIAIAAVLPRAPSGYTQPNSVAGYSHFLVGGGAPQTMRTSDIQWKVDRSSVKEYVNNKIKTIAASAQGDASENIGSVSGKFTGTITNTKSGYSIKGVFTPGPDMYNFDIDSKRGFYGICPRNIANLIGGSLGRYIQTMSGGIISPTNYTINFNGSTGIDESW